MVPMKSKGFNFLTSSHHKLSFIMGKSGRSYSTGKLGIKWAFLEQNPKIYFQIVFPRKRLVVRKNLLDKSCRELYFIQLIN